MNSPQHPRVFFKKVEAMAAVLFQNPSVTHKARRPRFEGANISTWIGFKHMMYLVEEAVLECLREHQLAPQTLYETYGLCFEIVDSSVRITQALYMDEVVELEVQPVPETKTGEVHFKVQLFVERDGKRVRAVSGKVKALWRREPHLARTGAIEPEALQPYSYNEIQRVATTPARIPPPPLVAPESNAFVWQWRIPYFYCHFSKRMQHSGYLRVMEEIVDLFLAARGISIRHMLETRAWIPVVPQARVEILEEALMEEELYSVYTIEDIFKDLTYTARLDCYVSRSGRFVHTATGRIVHGYAKIRGAGAWELVSFDDATLTALRGSPV